jgi:hypothetical protein
MIHSAWRLACTLAVVAGTVLTLFLMVAAVTLILGALT